MKKGWTYKKLGDIASYVNGFPFKPTDWVEDGKPIIRIQNLTGSQSKFNRCNRDDIPSKYFVRRGDILISWSATLGVYKWELEDALLNQHIFKVVFNKIKINKSFFRYAIIISLAEMARHTNGATMKHIRKGDFDNIEIPIPSLAEQERIVERLDAAFAQIDELKSNAERQLAEARALFQSALTQAMQPKPGWQEKPLKEITTKIGSGATPRGGKAVYIDNGVALIRSMNVHNGFFKYDNLAHISDEAANQLNGVELKQNDVLFNITGASIARCCVVPDDVIPARVNQHVAIIRPITDIVYPRFLSYVLMSKTHQKELLSIGLSGSTRQALTKKDLENHVVSLPSPDEQRVILDYLDNYSLKVRELEEISRKTAAECDAMKQALLRQIFE